MCDYTRRPVGIRFRRIDGLERRRKRARSVAPDQALNLSPPKRTLFRLCSSPCPASTPFRLRALARRWYQPLSDPHYLTSRLSWLVSLPNLSPDWSLGMFNE